ncbi:MAG: type II toxin-antitoxin system RelE/ParE family toxin [Alphaproteobacteria bacterium]|nr:type II toxin-antitoxin system RelE/ParE family toxin [Alphaproteobacteria bacterium]MBU1552797.1 type II toxin-antitoxin system RelE/ParE family toxin [Alphaproteobacteria bacterium]MBU2337054.1 type II toxin-antitoxin system RelE/ParE family toxin [Alphaproteobacteria bacterium]MBU2389064.1 type II toxin-antitoxin system RelE/ParE family toxin [Alphaproteobacteria bacterium]
MTLEFSSEAESDLEQIADYILQDNSRRALSFIRELRSQCEDLVDRPNGFAPLPRDETHGICRRVHGTYLIVYRVETVRVIIVHVLVSRRREGPAARGCGWRVGPRAISGDHRGPGRS